MDLVVSSRYRHFNVKQRLSGMGLTRRFLFVWQTSFYEAETVPHFLKTFKAVMGSSFLAEDTIKPVLSYLAAYLHHGKRNVLPSGAILNVL